MIKSLLPLRLLASFVFVVLVGVTLPVPPVEAYDSAVQPCGYSAGLSNYASPGVPNSGRIDYSRGGWSMNLANINEALPGRGLAIAATDALCFDPNGEVYGNYKWVWNNNFGWIDFAWCDPAVLPGCENETPFIDFANPNAYGAPWGGKVWNDNIGWIDFDWCYTSGLIGCELYEVHTVLPNPWPTVSTGAVGQIRGSAWNDRVGWIKFGDLNGAVLQQLPNGVGPAPTGLTVIPEVTITPDPAFATKYGGGTGVIAPKADGEDYYKIMVRFREDGTSNYLDPLDYGVSIAVDTTVDSNFPADKLGGTGPDAVFIPTLTAGTMGSYFIWSVKSLAPTSNVNGADINNDGVIDYYYDLDENGDPSGSFDHYEITGLDFVLNPVNSNILPATVDSNWSLGQTWDLKFAPAIEVSNLNYNDGSSYLSALPSIVNELLDIKGLIVKWTPFLSSSDSTISSGEQTFDVNGETSIVTTPSDLTVDFVFDSNSVNNVASLFDVSTLLRDSVYLAAYASSDYVPVQPVNNYWTLSQGTQSLASVTIQDALPDTTSSLDPSYETFVDYYRTDPLTGSPIFVSYASNYLPRTYTGPIVWILNYLDADIDSSPTAYPSPVTYPILIQDAKIIGSVTGSSALQTVTPGGDVTLIGNVTTYRVRNALFQRLSKLKKGVAVTSGGCGLTNSLTCSNGGASLLGGDLLYFSGGDVVIPASSNYLQKTIVVEGGDIYIQGNLDGGANALGLVAFKSYAQVGGNIYIKPNVQVLNKVNMYADGSLLSTDQDSPSGATTIFTTISSRQDALKKQLYIGGSLISKNTIGGVDAGLLPTGATTNNTFIASKYDLNHLREFQICWNAVAANAQGVPLVPLMAMNQSGNTWTWIPPNGPLPVDPTYFTDCPGYTRSPAIPSNSNEPLRIEYIPPPSSLPLLGEMQGGGFNLF